jgi:hypothetical protein
MDHLRTSILKRRNWIFERLRSEGVYQGSEDRQGFRLSLMHGNRTWARVSGEFTLGSAAVLSSFEDRNAARARKSFAYLLTFLWNPEHVDVSLPPAFIPEMQVLSWKVELRGVCTVTEVAFQVSATVRTLLSGNTNIFHPITTSIDLCLSTDKTARGSRLSMMDPFGIVLQIGAGLR